MAERNLSVDHVTIWRWVQRYAPVLNQRIRREMRHPNRSWRVDETYIKVAGTWAYLYRAVDSAGETIEFMLSPKRDLIAATLFLRLALSGGRPRPRVINVDGHPAYTSAVAELKQSGELGRRCRCRTAPYLNNIIEQDHRFIKKRITASLGFRSVEGACRTIEGYEAMHAIRKGQIRWLAGMLSRSANSSTRSSVLLRSSHRERPPSPLRSRYLQQNLLSVPELDICAVRSLLRHCEGLVQMACGQVLHMQKALDQMNPQIHHLISDITGMTGLAIIDAVLEGERNPRVLAKLLDWRIRASEETIAKSLVGDYRSEHLLPSAVAEGLATISIAHS